ncbi:hypothetical protein DPMN_008503 [Dreissena polymorpha]|uniref:PX domain-containing protein n=1 Tax=Dreissena polymorpha TaxID=45954 RepID=A0A9D4RX09_DREPO|nr:hypothetical protein DPMN_008503 [Dreissena polymorpha]
MNTKCFRQGNAVVCMARKYQEFYILEQKLKEFHGLERANVVPSAQMLYILVCPNVVSNGGLQSSGEEDFIDGKRDALEQYIQYYTHVLQKLLTLPYLKGSQLLYTFLTSDKAFDFGLDINIGKLKGKHLESFLQSFEKSIEAKAPTPG